MSLSWLLVIATSFLPVMASGFFVDKVNDELVLVHRLLDRVPLIDGYIIKGIIIHSFIFVFN